MWPLIDEISLNHADGTLQEPLQEKNSFGQCEC